MARSYKHTPIFGVCYGNPTPARRGGVKAHRRAVAMAVSAMATMGQDELEGLVLVDLGVTRQGDPWDWPDDGRTWCGHILAGEQRNKLLAK